MENAAETAAETGFAPLPEDQLQEAVDYLEGLK
jgi:phosphate transport system substrate-binding protein